MKKSLTLALALVALAVFSGDGLAQHKGDDRKPADAPVMEQQPLQQQDHKLTQTAFTYQGQLKEGGVPANGTYSLRFALHTAQSEGRKLGVVTKDDVVVANGSFTVQLDFGSDAFRSNESWLEVGVRPANAANSAEPYTAISPRQRLTPRIAADERMVKGINFTQDAVDPAAGNNVTIQPSGSTLAPAPQESDTWTKAGTTVRLSTSTDNVGIGTTKPRAKLDVDGAIHASEAVSVGNSVGLLSSSSLNLIEVDDPHPLAIGFSNPMSTTPGLLLFPNIKVGIGTIGPTNTLDVNGQARIRVLPPNPPLTNVVVADANGVLFSRPASTIGGGNSWLLAGNALTGNEVLGSTNNLPLRVITNGTDQMRILTNGNVGIGTTTPNEQLEITKNFRLPASTASAGVIKSGANRFIHNFGVFNFFAGVDAGNFTMTGCCNTAVGKDAFQSNTAGVQNVALGRGALKNNTIGGDNTAMGNRVMESNTTGRNNTAVGSGALLINTTGFNNIALGGDAGNQLTTGSFNIYIGSPGGTPAESNTIRIGTSQTKSFIAGIRNVATGVADAFPVLIDSNGQLGTLNSSRRFKEHIEDMGVASEVLYRLRPVSFLYKPEYGGRPDLPQFGLIAEDVAKVAPELVAYDGQGQPYTVYYQFLAPMLLNELQKKDAEIGTLRARLDALEKLVEGLIKK